MVQLKVFVTLALAFLASDSAFAQNAKVSAPKAPVKASTPPTKQSTTPNWVGPIKGIPTDSACYRKAYIAKNKKCGAGYNFDNIATCWTQCPIEFPVQCGMECIPQNKDCTKEVLTKVMSVANVAINAATSGVFGQLTKAAKGVQIGVMCGQSLFNAVQKIVGYIDEVEKGAKADTTKEQLMFLLGKSDFAVYDLPAAVATCIGIPVPKGLDQAKEVVDVVKTIISKIVDSKSSGKNLLDFKTFLNFTSTIQSVSTAKPTTTTSAPPAANSFAMSTLSAKDQETLKKLVSSGTTCGPQLKSVIDKIVAAVQDLIKQKPTDPIGAMQFAIKNSGLVLVDLPAATVGCWDENAPDGFKTRDDIIKTMHVIIDKIIASASQNGKTVSLGDYALTIADMGLNVIAVFDPTGIAAMAREFVQPICGPTVYVGQIDDGPADKAVGLESMEKAFRNSTGVWKKQGDGKLKVTFKSVDDHDVRVNVMSGGKKVYEVKVPKGQTVEFVKPLTEFQGKTLYLDRWRAGFFGIPGTGGGSLLSWVPDNSKGSLVIEAHINPTSFSDHKRRV